MNAAQLRDFATRYNTAWCSHQAALVAEFFSEDAWLTLNGEAPAKGRQKITELVRSFMNTFPDMRVIMNDLRLHVGCADFYWTLIGTNTAPGGTGRRVRVSGFERWRIGDDGLISSSQTYFDADEYQLQLSQG
jgi:uncharacterized protein (TIGR02246 family)